MIFVQVMIFIFGASAIWFVSRTEHWKRWGYIIGLCGQPFWFYTAYKNEQWGILFLTLFYTYSWGQGIWNYWLKGIRLKKEFNNPDKPWNYKTEDKR